MAGCARAVLSSIQNTKLEEEQNYDGEKRDVFIQLCSNKHGIAGKTNSGYPKERSDVLLQILSKKYGLNNASGSGEFILLYIISLTLILTCILICMFVPLLYMRVTAICHQSIKDDIS